MGLCAPRLAPNPLHASSLRSVLQRLDPLAAERRNKQRADFCYRLLLTPLDQSEAPSTAVTVVGRNLTLVGVGFEHPDPLPYRKARLSAADPRLEAMGLAGLEIEVLLRWCRFVESGRYESGGRILRSNTRDLIG